MSQYIVRVELHRATASDYELLHSEMERRGFSRSILGTNGRTYRLPTAEYRAETGQTGEEVRSIAAEAAAASGCAYAVLVAETVGTWWTGLSAATSSGTTAR